MSDSSEVIKLWDYNAVGLYRWGTIKMWDYTDGDYKAVGIYSYETLQLWDFKALGI